MRISMIRHQLTTAAFALFLAIPPAVRDESALPDLDALPVTEKTGRPYASTVRTRDKAGNEVGVMHACGHDIHMTCWVGTARTLAGMKDRWSGTPMFIGQPAEEVGAGARMMLDDGLFKRFPKPDYALALHCDSRLQTGRVAFTEGLALANV